MSTTIVPKQPTIEVIAVQDIGLDETLAYMKRREIEKGNLVPGTLEIFENRKIVRMFEGKVIYGTSVKLFSLIVESSNGEYQVVYDGRDFLADPNNFHLNLDQKLLIPDYWGKVD